MFDRLAQRVATIAGSSPAFSCALLLVILWVPSIVLFGSVDTWQLVINTTTTIVTFLLLFVLQHSQNKDTAEIKAMLRELLDAIEEARPAAEVVREAQGDRSPDD